MKTPGTAHHYNNGGGHHRGSMQSDTSPDSRIYIPSITSQEILDENSQSQQNRMRRSTATRKAAILLCLVVVAAAGAVAAYVMTSGGSTSTSNASGTNASKDSTSGTNENGQVSSGKSTSSGTGTDDSDGNGKVLSDPSAVTFPLTAFAIGDWGSTVALNSSCCQRRKGIYNGYDWHAEAAVTKLMDLDAGNKKPKVVISHGDNFYWTGIDGDGDQAYRFDLTFEQRHKTEAMMDVPWINVMGNHDYGGGSYICMTDNGRRPCDGTKDLLDSLQKRFTLQSSYVSPNNNRWVLKDHFYVYRIEEGDVSMDIFNLDMNDAESHGANEICCQCYDQTEGDDKKCKGTTRGGPYCINGDTAMYDACVGQFNKWGEEAMMSLIDEVKQSTATWKIVNSHYNPYGHYGETSGKAWMQALQDIKDVHVWIAGHTHGEKHDYAEFGTHFIENGAGGGIQSESASGIPPWATGVSNLWTAPGLGEGGSTYGFFAIDASKEWLKVRYMTFDNNWALTKDGSNFADSKLGGVSTGWCWYVPADGAKGQAC